MVESQWRLECSPATQERMIPPVEPKKNLMSAFGEAQTFLVASRGECPEDPDYRSKCEALEQKNKELQEKVDDLTQQLAALALSASAGEQSEEEDGLCGDEAARKRLMRICTKNVAGSSGNIQPEELVVCALCPKHRRNKCWFTGNRGFTPPQLPQLPPAIHLPSHLSCGVLPFADLRKLQVPQAVHDAWVAGGTERKKLQEIFAQSGFEKDGASHVFQCLRKGCPTRVLGITSYISESFARFQASFLKHVKVQFSESEKVKVKCRAMWATEDRMRDIMRLKEWPDSP